MAPRARLRAVVGLIVPRPLAAFAGVAVVAVACVGAYALVAERPPLAGTEVLVDTPGSMLAGAPVAGAQTISDRAYALAAQLGRERARRILLARTGREPHELSVAFEAIAQPASATPLAAGAAGASRPRAPAQLVVGLPDERSPLIALRASAPDPEQAERLVLAGVAALRALAAPPPRAAPSLDVRRLGAVLMRPGASPPSPALIAAGGALACLAWLALLAGLALRADRRPPRARLAEAAG